MSYKSVGNWRQFFHWGPILALSVIFIITWVTVRCHLMWWPPWDSVEGFINLFVFLFWVTLTLYNYFAACLKGPGFIPLGWKPKEPSHANFLQYCDECEGYKAPRSHHCKKCQRCVMKMDHHCPWINTCCGHFNHGNFCYFLIFAPIGCIHALFILIPSVYHALNFSHYYHYSNEPLVYLGVLGFIGTMFSIGLSIGVIIAVGALFFLQFKSILKNETGIESWIIDKAEDRERGEDEEEEFIYPYNLGWRENLRQVFTWSGRPKSSGFHWDVLPGCHQFTLTVEQLMQKREKRERTLHFEVTNSYSGRLFPVCAHGCRTGCCVPCTDERRLPVDIGDIVYVTRWKKHWLYGCKVIPSTAASGRETTKRVRGWFPRHCGIRRDDLEEVEKKLS